MCSHRDRTTFPRVGCWPLWHRKRVGSTRKESQISVCVVFQPFPFHPSFTSTTSVPPLGYCHHTITRLRLSSTLLNTTTFILILSVVHAWLVSCVSIVLCLRQETISNSSRPPSTSCVFKDTKETQRHDSARSFENIQWSTWSRLQDFLVCWTLSNSWSRQRSRTAFYLCKCLPHEGFAPRILDVNSVTQRDMYIAIQAAFFFFLFQRNQDPLSCSLKRILVG